jgi:hypothetical protein
VDFGSATGMGKGASTFTCEATSFFAFSSVTVDA